MKKTTYIITAVAVVLLVIGLVYFFTKKEAGDINQNLNTNVNAAKTNINTNTNQAVANLNTNQTTANQNINQANVNAGQTNQNSNKSAVTNNFTQTGILSEQTTGFNLVWETPGNPTNFVTLQFDYQNTVSQCTVDGAALTCQMALDENLLLAGDQVTITGYKITADAVAVTMLDK